MYGRRLRLILIAWVCAAAVVLSALLISALHVPMHKLSQAEWERYRRDGIADFLYSINTSSELRKQVYALKSEGCSLNQAVASVIKRMEGEDLSPGSWGGAPIVIHGDEGRPVLVDMRAEPYDIAERNGRLVLLKSCEAAPRIP